MLFRDNNNRMGLIIVWPAFLFFSFSTANRQRGSKVQRKKLAERKVVVAKYSGWVSYRSESYSSDVVMKRRTHLNMCTVKLEKNSNHIPRRPIPILTWKNCLSHNYKLSTNCSFTLFPLGNLTFLKMSQDSFTAKLNGNLKPLMCVQ